LITSHLEVLGTAILVSSPLYRPSANKAEARIFLAQDMPPAMSPLSEDSTLLGQAQYRTYRASPQSSGIARGQEVRLRQLVPFGKIGNCLPGNAKLRPDLRVGVALLYPLDDLFETLNSLYFDFLGHFDIQPPPMWCPVYLDAVAFLLFIISAFTASGTSRPLVTDIAADYGDTPDLRAKSHLQTNIA
jgi:hypothetical protein